jgi:hypothetical protein
MTVHIIRRSIKSLKTKGARLPQPRLTNLRIIAFSLYRLKEVKNFDKMAFGLHDTVLRVSCFFVIAYLVGWSGSWNHSIGRVLSSADMHELTLDGVFFLIEGHDKKMETHAADAICSTWLRHVPPQNSRFYSDTIIPLPESCVRIGHNHTFPCHPGDKSLGESIQSAQVKRENIHLRFAQELRINEDKSLLPSGVRWIVSTEQDAWWDPTVVLRYLRSLEAKIPAIHDVPAIGPWQIGPFLVFNVRMLQDVLGNEDVMNHARNNLTGSYPYPIEGWKYDGAPYNNDHLVEWATRLCSRSGGKCKKLNVPRCRGRKTEVAFVYNSESAQIHAQSSNVSAHIASFHHVKSREEMMLLEESAEINFLAAANCGNNCSSFPIVQKPCMIWRTDQQV